LSAKENLETDFETNQPNTYLPTKTFLTIQNEDVGCLMQNTNTNLQNSARMNTTHKEKSYLINDSTDAKMENNNFNEKLCPSLVERVKVMILFYYKQNKPLI